MVLRSGGSRRRRQDDVVDEPGAAQVGGDTQGGGAVHGALDGLEVLGVHQLEVLDLSLIHI